MLGAMALCGVVSTIVSGDCLIDGPGNAFSTLYKPWVGVYEQESRLTTIPANYHHLHLQHPTTQQDLYIPTHFALRIPQIVISRDLGQGARYKMQKAELKVFV